MPATAPRAMLVQMYVVIMMLFVFVFFPFKSGGSDVIGVTEPIRFTLRDDHLNDLECLFVL